MNLKFHDLNKFLKLSGDQLSIIAQIVFWQSSTDDFRGQNPPNDGFVQFWHHEGREFDSWIASFNNYFKQKKNLEIYQSLWLKYL